LTSHVPLAAQVRRAQRNGIGDLLWRSAERFPDKTAIVYRNIRQSYAQLDETVNRMANALTERGIRKGDRIALLSHNNHGSSWFSSPLHGSGRFWCRSTSC